MNKILKRFIAYFIDLFIIVLISQSLSGVPVINKQLNTYNKYYNEYIELVDAYGEFKSDLLKKYEDNKLTEKEYDKLLDKHEHYKSLLEEHYSDKKLTKKEYNKINKEIDSEYTKKYKDFSYKLDKNSTVYFIIYLVVVFAYFVFFNKITNGQTLGKKLTRLRIASNKYDCEVSVWSYIIRTILLYQPVSYLFRLSFVNILDINNYYNVITIIASIQRYLQMIIIMMIILRMDGRGLHDLLAKTKVVSLDKQGNIIEDVIPFSDVIAKKKKEINNKKIIDEPNK